MRSRFRSTLLIVLSTLLGACSDDLATFTPVLAPQQAVVLDEVVGDWFDASVANAAPDQDLIIRRAGSEYIVRTREQVNKGQAGYVVRLGFLGEGMYAQTEGKQCVNATGIARDCYYLYRVALVNGELRIYKFDDARLGRTFLQPTSLSGVTMQMTAGTNGPSFSSVRIDNQPVAVRAFIASYASAPSAFSLYQRLRRRGSF